jgi:hypothetical protein
MDLVRLCVKICDLSKPKGVQFRTYFCNLEHFRRLTEIMLDAERDVVLDDADIIHVHVTSPIHIGFLIRVDPKWSNTVLADEIAGRLMAEIEQRMVNAIDVMTSWYGDVGTAISRSHQILEIYKKRRLAEFSTSVADRPPQKTGSVELGSA